MSLAEAQSACATPGDSVLGGSLLRVPPPAQISWLAVRGAARGQGIGRALVAEALSRYSTATEILVDTFGEDNAAGRPARRLYESFGFAAAENLERGPEGGTRQRFRLRRRSAEPAAAVIPRGSRVSLSPASRRGGRPNFVRHDPRLYGCRAINDTVLDGEIR